MRTHKVIWLDDEPATIMPVVQCFLDSSNSRYEVEMIEDSDEMFSKVDVIGKESGFVVVDMNLGDDQNNGGLELAKRLNKSAIPFIVVSASIPSADTLQSLIKLKSFVNFFHKATFPNILGFQINAALVAAEKKIQSEKAMGSMQLITTASVKLSMMKGVDIEKASDYHRAKANKNGLTVEEWCQQFLEEWDFSRVKV